MAELMKVAIHFPNRAAPPQGIWWWDGQNTRMSSLYHDSDMETLGQATMGRVAAEPGFFDVEGFFDALSERMTIGDVWGTAVVEDMSPPEYLAFLRKQYKRKGGSAQLAA